MKVVLQVSVGLAAAYRQGTKGVRGSISLAGRDEKPSAMKQVTVQRQFDQPSKRGQKWVPKKKYQDELDDHFDRPAQAGYKWVPVEAKEFSYFHGGTEVNMGRIVTNGLQLVWPTIVAEMGVGFYTSSDKSKALGYGSIILEFVSTTSPEQCLQWDSLQNNVGCHYEPDVIQENAANKHCSDPKYHDSTFSEKTNAKTCIRKDNQDKQIKWNPVATIPLAKERPIVTRQAFNNAITGISKSVKGDLRLAKIHSTPDEGRTWVVYDVPHEYGIRVGSGLPADPKSGDFKNTLNFVYRPLVVKAKAMLNKKLSGEFVPPPMVIKLLKQLQAILPTVNPGVPPPQQPQQLEVFLKEMEALYGAFPESA